MYASYKFSYFLNMKLNRSFYSFNSGVFLDFSNTSDLAQLSIQGTCC